jgi:ABC-type branched-subunit amino acid transport system ATPase component
LTGFILLTLLTFLPRGVVGLLSDLSPLRTRAPENLQAVGTPPKEERTSRVSNHSGADLLSVENVSLSFGGLAALKNISFAVREDEIVSIIGPNGAGKTSVFNTISGFYRPDSGIIHFDGQSLLDYAAHRRASMGISRTFQNLELFPDMSVLDNVLVGTHTQLRNSGIESALRLSAERQREHEQRLRASALLDFVGLREYALERAGNLSFGHQRLLEIARALASRPKLLMLDEPAAGLNSAEMAALTRIIRLARSEYGTSVLLIAHTMSLVMDLSDRIIVLHHGEKIAEGNPETIQRNQTVIDAYLGEAAEHA